MGVRAETGEPGVLPDWNLGGLSVRHKPWPQDVYIPADTRFQDLHKLVSSHRDLGASLARSMAAAPAVERSAHAPEVVHLGPDPAVPGGIASVITVLCDHGVGGRCDVIVSWRPGGRGARLAAMARAALAVVRLPRTAIVHAHMAADGSIVRKGALLALARRTGHHTVVTVHGSRFEASSARRPRLTAAALGQAEMALVLSPQMQRIVGELAPQLPVELFANPVEVDAAPSAPSGRAPLVVFAGEVGERKGADVLAAAWPLVRASVPDARLCIAGPPTDLQIDPGAGAELLGSRSRAEVRELLRGARVAVLPSRAEALPMMLLEAMGCGTPIVATDVGDVRRLTDLGAGVLSPVGDAAALADALIALLTDDAAADRYGAAGHAACAEHFSIDAIAAQTERHYAALRSR